MPSVSRATSAGGPLTSGSRIVDKVLGIDRLQALYEKLEAQPKPILEGLLDELQVHCEIDPRELRRIPPAGAAIVVANHPFGMLDGALMASTLGRVRKDFKILTNWLLAGIPEVADHCIFVDPFGGPGSVDANRPGLRSAISWLRSGGLLAIFPAGEVAHWRPKEGVIADPPWNRAAARLARMARVPVIPVHIDGANSIPFQLMGAIHPRLRTAALPHELLNKRNRRVQVRVGRAIDAEQLGAIATDEDAIGYLRWRTCLLASQTEKQLRMPFHLPDRKKPVALPASADVLAAEVESLPPGSLLASSGGFRVMLARSLQIPEVLKEIGRLRELTFRAVGEGTGRVRDIDSFDRYYQHLFLWNDANREIAGAYRLAYTSEVVPKYGIEGLYTHTLFVYDHRLLEKTGPAVELGRSFIRPEYQKQYAPLLLLWKGIAKLLVSRPEAPVLFGAVSISNEYKPATRRLVAGYLEQRYGHQLSELVRPRKPFRQTRMHEWDFDAIARLVRDYDDLADPVADLEGDGKALPILLKQYLKLGGKMLGFNVDPRFENALDGLVVLDLRETDPAILARLIGKK